MPAKKSTGRVTPKKTPAAITDGSEWARDARSQRVDGKPLTVPSGKTCLVRRPDSLATFTDKGMIPNRLMPIVMDAIGGKKIEEETQIKMMQDPDLLLDMIGMVDNVVVDCVIQPEVTPVPYQEDGSPLPPQHRPDDDTLYVDYIDMEDRFFIFNYALSGVSDVERFRSESAESMAPLRSVKTVEQSTE
jgi:hypothetical protein